METRHFEIMDPNKPINMPVRATKNSAGYDLCAAQDVTIEPGAKAIIRTNVVAYMPEDEVLLLFPRSSYGIKHNLMLANGVGVIDADYRQEILVCYRNIGDKPFHISQGERIAQGVFCKYWKAARDTSKDERIGGIGSTGNGAIR